MNVETLVIISNTILMAATLIATLYRIKIERDQVKVIVKNAGAQECLKQLRKHVKSEHDDILKMDQKELKELLDSLEHLGEEL